MSIFGFIGTGNMGTALASAAVREVPGDNIYLSNRTQDKAKELAGKLGAVFTENDVIAAKADFIILGVKPQGLQALFDEIAPILQSRKSNFVLVTMAAGTEIAQIQQMAGINVPVIRIMPNISVNVGKGVILFSASEEVAANRMQEFIDGMSGAGTFYELPESQIDAASAISGCGPAFIAMFMEAMADGAVACGLPRELSYKLVSETLLGTSSLQIETDLCPSAFKDIVCSPAGTTIEGVRTLEECGFRGAVMDAVIAAFEKNESFK